MKIIVDNREHILIKLLKALNTDYEFGLEIEVAKMDIGDIAILNDEDEELLLIERKKISDLAASIRDGRYKEQSYRLNGHSLHNHNIIYLIEGKISFFSNKYSKVTPGTLYVTTFCLNYFKGFSVIRTFDVTETAEYILRLTDKLKREKEKFGFYHSKFVKKEKDYVDVIPQVKKNNITKNNIGEIILSQIPGVSKATAKIIMKNHDSLYKLLESLSTDPKCLNSLTMTIKNGKSRHLSQTSISNIIKYLLHPMTHTLKVDTSL